MTSSLSKNATQYDVDVDIHATVRVTANSEDEALDAVQNCNSLSGSNIVTIHSVFPLTATEA